MGDRHGAPGPDRHTVVRRDSRHDRAQPSGSVRGADSRAARRPDATSLLADVRCPTLVLCGRQDTWSPLARHATMAGAIPGAVLCVVEHSGHMSPMERPEDVAGAMRAWLSQAEARAL
ncbi:alpha/beta fold hydrolase [Pandoraea pnomenusa]|uniref:alpha/beta fold hydrolase n=1 Tax=Pandoraea pnomenusa TaxID=93220 RepID=UPI003CF9FC79